MQRRHDSGQVVPSPGKQHNPPPCLLIDTNQRCHVTAGNVATRRRHDNRDTHHHLAPRHDHNGTPALRTHHHQATAPHYHTLPLPTNKDGPPTNKDGRPRTKMTAHEQRSASSQASVASASASWSSLSYCSQAAILAWLSTSQASARRVATASLVICSAAARAWQTVLYAAEAKSGFSARLGSCVRRGMVCGKEWGGCQPCPGPR